MRALLLAGTALLAVSGSAHAAITSLTANLTTPIPPSGSALTPITLQGIMTPAATTSGTGFSVAYVGADPSQGIVQGTIPSTTHAVPVAGVTMGSTPQYLTGDFGSALTSNANASGNYLSTGLGTITITFTTPQTSLALLWGSIDPGNTLTIGTDTVTGTQIKAAAGSFTPNGFQGPNGAAYVSLTDSTPFTKVTLTSSIVSFEAAGIAGSNQPFSAPEPVSLAVLGAGLLGLGLARRRA